MVNLDLAKFERAVARFPKFSGTQGSIVRISVKDFMTYRNVELRAGPNVNLIMGPNGTGKSTIVCAILLGLAGNPTFLGRARQLKEYIRHGASESTIEVELHGGNEKNTTIKRIITETEGGKGSRSQWFINGNRDTEKNVENLMKKLNIQLDNLCQFLPQDRVQDFAKMDAVELLENTEKSIDHTNGLMDVHTKLKEIQAEVTTLEENKTWTLEQLRGETTQTTRMENDVKRYHERNEIQEQINKLVGRKVWFDYLDALDVYTALQNKLKDLRKKKDAEEKIVQPLKKEIDQFTQKLTQFRHILTNCKNNVESTVEKVRREYIQESDKIETLIHASKVEVHAVQNQETERLAKLNEKRERLMNLQREYDETQAKGDYNESLMLRKSESLKAKNLEILQKRFEYDAQIRGNNEEISQKRCSLQQLQKEQNEMQEFRNSRMRYLEKAYPDVFKAVKYFFDKEHPERLDEFEGELHEPLILEISVNDLAYGHIAERHIPNSDLIAFYTNNRNDVKRLIDAAQKLKWRVSCIHHELGRNFVKPTSILNDKMRSLYDFQTSLIDLIEVGDYYMSYICKTTKPHEALIGTDKTDALTTEIMSTNLRTYYTKKTVVTIRTSSYSSRKNSTTSYLNDARIFTNSINAPDIQTIQRDIDDYQKQINKLKATVEAFQTKREECIGKERQLEEEMRELQQKIQYRRNLANKIEASKRSISDTENEARDITGLRERAKKKILDDKFRQIPFLRSCCLELTDLPNKWMDSLDYAKRTTIVQQCSATKQEILNSARIQISTLTDELKTEEEKTKSSATEANRLKIEARMTTQTDEPPEDLALHEDEKATIDSEINKLRARLNFLPQPDASVITEFHERQKKIEKLEANKLKLERTLREKTASIEDYKKAWLTKLQKSMKDIDRNFGNFFRQMNCVGQVALDDGGDPNNFAKYGIKIKVKFRANEELVELTGWKQSGGERAITTALYILSLQQLTTVPFRVIDEINQGMDAKNEARFFKLLCSLADGHGTPQYFLLTPKMLPPVSYPSNVDFHIIFNGPHVQVDWRNAVQIPTSSRRAIAQEDSDDDD